MKGPIATDELLSPGYVWLSCEAYPTLPDNTRGTIGYHCTYRPLAVHPNGCPQYQGNEAITDAMRVDIRAYYATREADRLAAQVAQEALPPVVLDALQGLGGSRARPGVTTPCPSCGTYCAGDCRT